MNYLTADGSDEPGTAPLPVILFGRDGGGKGHASRFTPADAALAERAAGLMGMKVLRLESAAQIEIGSQVSPGKIFSGGKALCPFVSKSVFERLDTMAGAFTPARPPEAEMPASEHRRPTRRAAVQPSKAAESNPDGEKAVPDRAAPPADRDALTVGHRCLAAEENAPEVWYLAEVTALKGPALLQLVWVGEGNMPTSPRSSGIATTLPCCRPPSSPP